MRVRISGNGRARDVELPLPDAQLAWQMEQLWDGSGDLNCTLESAYGDRNPLRRLTGQKVNMDEINFFAKGWTVLRHTNGVCWRHAHMRRKWEQ